MVKKGLVVLLVAMCLTFFVYAANEGLEDYPKIFTEMHNENLVFVIGDFADVADAIGSIDIATSLQAASESSTTIGSAKLASEIDEIEDYNIISVGGPCANPVSSELMGYPENCIEGFVPGIAQVKLFSNGDNLAMVVAGATAIDTQRACRVMAQPENYNLVGREILIEGTNLKDLVINQR